MKKALMAIFLASYLLCNAASASEPKPIPKHNPPTQDEINKGLGWAINNAYDMIVDVDRHVWKCDDKEKEMQEKIDSLSRKSKDFKMLLQGCRDFLNSRSFR